MTRLDPSTLTVTEMRDLIDAVLKIKRTLNASFRDDLITHIPEDVSRKIFTSSRGTAEDEISEIWTACSKAGCLDELVDLLDPASSMEMINLKHKIELLKGQVKRRENFTIRIADLAKLLSALPGSVKAINQQRSDLAILLPGSDLGPRQQSLRDLLLVLLDFSGGPPGSVCFPLFSFVEGTLTTISTQCAPGTEDAERIAQARSQLNGILEDKSLSREEIAQMRNRAKKMLVHSEPSFQVIIEPRKIAQSVFYDVQIFEWIPWETLELREAAGGTQGRRRACTEPTRFPKGDRSHMLAYLGEAMGPLLRETVQPRPIVEFIVPAAFFFEPFDRIQAETKVYTDDDGFTIPYSGPLCHAAIVVVRSLERAMKQLAGPDLSKWREKQGTFAASVSSPEVRWIEQINDLERIDLSETVLCLAVNDTFESEESGAVSESEAEQARIKAAKRSLAVAIFTHGIPIAVWTRGNVAEEPDGRILLRKLVEGKNPPDLRDRIWDARRADVGSLNLGCSIGTSLTLFWDDPDRLPAVFTAAIASPLS